VILTVHRRLICGDKMPTRCNRWFLLQIFLLAQHVLGTIIPIIRRSRVLYRWLLPVAFGALVFKLSVWCGAEGFLSSFHILTHYSTSRWSFPPACIVHSAYYLNTAKMATTCHKRHQVSNKFLLWLKDYFSTLHFNLPIFVAMGFCMQ
jgi:hypothetical protein